MDEPTRPSRILTNSGGNAFIGIDHAHLLLAGLPAHVRRTLSAVESTINGLEVHRLDVCPGHGIEGFKRYVALAVLTRNIHRIGAIVWSQDMERAQQKSRYADPNKPVKLAA